MRTVEFTVMGVRCVEINGGPSLMHSWAFTFQVATVDQDETDRYWNAIVNNDGEERVWLVPGQVGNLVADHTARADERNDRL